MQRCTRQLQVAGYVCVLPATLAVAALSSLCTSDTGHSDDGIRSESWLGNGLGSSGSCHAPTGAPSWLHVLCVAACWSLLLWQVLGLARRFVCLQRSCEVPAAPAWAQACNSSDDQQQQQQQQRGWPASRRHARAAAKVAPPPADTAAAAAQGRAYRSLGAAALGPWSLVATPPPVPDPQQFHMLRLLRQLSECFTAQHVHSGSLAKPQCSSADSRLQAAPYSACSEHLVCSVKVYASWVHVPWLHPLLLRSLHQALAHTGVGSPAAAEAADPAGTSHRAPLSSSSCRGAGATSWAAQALVFRGCVHMLASAYRAKSVAAAAAAAAAAEDVAAFAGADQDWYRRRHLDRPTEGLQAQQALPQVEAAVGAAQEQGSSAAPHPQQSTGAASNRDVGVRGVAGVARLRVLWQEQPVLLADAAHRQLVVLHVGYDLQQQGTAHQQPAQVQEVRSPGSAAHTAQEPHATAVPAAAAGGSSSSGVGPDMMVRVLVFGHQQMLLDAAVRLGPVLRVWMPTVPTGLYHLALLPPAPIKGAGRSSASAAPLLMHPLLALPGPVADEVNRMWSTNSVLTGAVPRTVAALAAVMGVPGPAQDADPFAAAAAAAAGADQGAPPAPAARQSPAPAGAAFGSSDRVGSTAAAPATAAAAAAPSGGGGGMALAALFRSFEECASSILAGAVYPGSSRSGAGGHSLGGGPAPPPQPAALVEAAAAGVSPAAAAGAGPPVAEDRLTLLWQATMAGLLQDIACVFCCTGHGRVGGPFEEEAADDPADTPPASEAGSSRLGGTNLAGVDLSVTRATSNIGRMITTLDTADSGSLTDASSLSPSSSGGSIATSEDTVDWLAGLLQVLGPLLHHLAVQQKPLVSKLLVQQVLAAVGPNSNSRRGSALSSGSGISIGGATTLTDGTGAGSSRRASSISTAAECGDAASEVAGIVGQSASPWLGLLQRMCTWPLAPLLPQCTLSGRLGWAARSLPGAGSAGSSVGHVASAGSGPPAGALHAHDLQQQVLLRGMAPAAAEAAYLAHVHATTWWMDATLGMFDIFCQVSMGQLSDMPASLAQMGLAATLAAQRHQLLTLVLVAVPWALLMALRPALSRGNWRERMLLAAAACRSWCTLAPALGLMPHGAALAAGLSGSRWQVLAPIVGVGLFRPLQQQVRMRALLPIIFLECLGVCSLLGVYSSWSRALVRASCILVTASLSGILVERASRRLFLSTLQRQAAAIGPQGPQSCPSGPKDPPGHPHQRRYSEGPRGGSSSSGSDCAGAVKERLAERLRRRSQPVHST